METLLPELGQFGHSEIILMFKASLLVVLALFVYRVAHRFFKRFAQHGLIHEQLRLTLMFVVRWLLIIVTVLLLMGMFGVSVESMLAALSAILVMFAVGFVAVWSVLSNMLCSVLLVVFAPFRIGDEIELQDSGADVRVAGRVAGINLMHTTLVAMRDGAEEVIRVPNNFFFHKYIRRLPGKGTQSIKAYMAEQHESGRASEDTDDKGIDKK